MWRKFIQGNIMSSASVKFTDNSAEFKAKNQAFTDMVMGLMAANIETQIKTSGNTPFLTKSTRWAQRGALRASARFTKLGTGKYRVTVGTGSVAEAYAAAQEAGTTRGFTMKNYSTPGTGPHYFRKSIDTVMGREAEYIETARSAVGLDN